MQKLSELPNSWKMDRYRILCFPNVLFFRLERSINSSSWSTLQTVGHSAGLQTFNVYVPDLVRYSIYQFRIITNKDSFGFPEPGAPGPVSNKVSPICFGKSQST